MSNATTSDFGIEPLAAEDNLLSRFIKGNYFYFMSAALMLLGSYLFMNSEYIVGAVFAHTLKTLLILQAYEFVVILTALIIVRRLKALDDAFSLLIIELILLLDPTFFGNSFATMLKPEATAVNIACFLMAPIKLAILARYLKFRITPRAIMAFAIVAAFVYLIEGPVNHVVPFKWISRPGYYYLLTWFPLLFIALIPKRRIDFVQNHGFCDDRRSKVLNTLICIIPLLILFLHLIEDAATHEFKYYMTYAAPLVIACAVLLIKSIDIEKVKLLDALHCVDMLCAIAAVLALGWFEDFWKKSGKIYSWARDIKPDFVEAHIPLIACAAAVAGIYLYFYYKFRYRPALKRIAILAAAASLGIFHIPAVRALISSSAHILWQHSGNKISLAEIWAFTLLMITPIFHFIAAWYDELIGLALIAVLVRLHWGNRKPQPELVYFLAQTATVCAMHRFYMQPAFWTVIVIGVEMALLIAASALLKYRGYGVVALIQGFLFISVFFVMSDMSSAIPWLVLSVLAGVAMIYRNVYVGYFAGLLFSWLMFGLLPHDRMEWGPERFELMLFLTIAFDHYIEANKAGARKTRYILASVASVLSMVRFLDDPVLWSGSVVVAIVISLIIAAFLLRHFGYMLVSIILVTVFGWTLINLADIHIPFSRVIVTLAIILYILGVIVTFNKKRFVGWLNAGRQVKS